MSDPDVLRQLLGLSGHNAFLNEQRLKVEVLRYWTDELEKPRNAEPKRLLRYGFKTFSQNDEDGIIQEIFRRIGPSNRKFVEFGVQNGFECTSAKLLVEGWRGLWIEAGTQTPPQSARTFQRSCVTAS